MYVIESILFKLNTGSTFMSNSKPLNIILIIADQFRADCLSALEHPVVKTPNLDRLAADGKQAWIREYAAATRAVLAQRLDEKGAGFWELIFSAPVIFSALIVGATVLLVPLIWPF